MFAAAQSPACLFQLSLEMTSFPIDHIDQNLRLSMSVDGTAQCSGAADPSSGDIPTRPPDLQICTCRS